MKAIYSNLPVTEASSAKGPATRGNGPAPGRNSSSFDFSAAARNLRLPKIPQKDIASITSQLAIMIRTGVDIASALHSLTRQCQRPALRVILEDIHEGVMSGSSVSESLSKYVGIFGESYVASIAAGEASGRLPDVLRQLALLQRNELRLKKSIRTLLAYPILLSSISSIVVIALVVFVLPRFAQIFQDFDASLPFITQVLLGISTELRVRFWLWLPVVGAAGFSLAALRFSAPGRRVADRFVLNTMIIKDITQALTVGRICRLLGTMLESGLPLLDSLRLVRSSVRNSLYRDLFLELESNVLNGRGLSTALIESTIIPPAASEMIATAERTGTLGMVAEMLGAHFEEEGEAKLKEFVAMLEPAITVVMGVIVAIVVMSVMLPMFDLASVAQKGG